MLPLKGLICVYPIGVLLVLTSCTENSNTLSKAEKGIPTEGVPHAIQVERINWQDVDQGLELATIALPKSSVGIGDGTVTIVRIDPNAFRMQVLAAGHEAHGMLRAKEWADRHGLSVVINAGMFDTDHTSHVGYMRTDRGINQPTVHSDYASVLAFDPIANNLPIAKIYDTDETPFKTIQPQFRGMVQNLRLIKRPGENRWTQQSKRWSEAALGQDGAGNLLLIFCRTPYSMHDLNNHLLALPIDLVCAQHLEGGPEAFLYLNHQGTTFSNMGSYETGFYEKDDHSEFWPVPNVIGFSPRK